MIKNFNFYIFFIIIIIILLLLLFRNIFFNNIRNSNDKYIVFSEKFVDSYIKELEEEIKDFKEINNLDCINASVIYRNPVYWYDELIINKGKNDNIEKDSYVLTKDGLVGLVKEVKNNTSIITLLTSLINDKKITVKIKTDNESVYGLISGYDNLDNYFIVKDLTIDINNGSDVLTTSFTETFKEGLLIGKVIKVDNANDNLSKNVLVKPISNFNDIRNVCVTK